MSNRARKFLSRKLMFAATFVMVSAIATLAAFGPQAISLQLLLTPFVGASVAPQQSFKEVESQLYAEPPAPMSMIGGTLSMARSGHTATLLADGKVLIVGGSGDTSAEIFDSASGMSVATGNTNYARTGHTATTLSDGRVLIAGGGSASTEIYDPAAGTFANGPDMTTARSGHTATAVGTSVVISGGGSASVEVFDGTTFTAAGTLTESRTNHSAALMNDGRIFIAGGTGSDTAEIYNPADGTSVATGNPLAHQRAKAHLRVLPDGKVQIIGGNDDVSMEVYDPAIDTIGAHVHLLPDTDTCTGLRTGVRDSQTRAALFYAGNADASYDRTGHTITEVAGNRALVIGGTSASGASNAVTEFASSPATITTDKLDYAPGETVTFTGTNFAAGETVRVVIHEDPHTHLERNFEAVADASGNITGSYLVEEHDLNVKFVVNARGLTSNLTAQTAFTDANTFNVTPLSQSVAPGSTGTFVWTFTAQNAGNQQTTTFTIPAGWTAPQTSAGPGQITVAGSGGNPCNASLQGVSGMVVTIRQSAPFPTTGTCGNNTTFELTYANATAPSPSSSTVYTFVNQHGQDPTVTVSGDTTAPTVTINQAAGQADPTNASPINFTVVFSEPVNNFAGVDVDLFGTAGATTAVVTGGPTTYNVAVSGMTGDGTVGASIAANRATDAAGNQNTASTSTDNVVTYDGTAPTIVSITRNGASPTNAGQVTWTITFSESVTGVDPFDFTVPMTGLTGTASLSLFGGGGTTYTFTTDTRNGSGTIGLNLNDDDSITDAAGNKLGGTGIGVAGGGGTGNGSLVGQVYTIDRTITAVIVANDKPYDGGTAATLASCTRTSNLAITQDVDVVCSSPTFDDPNAGTRTVTANISLTGADASRYVLSSTTATDTAEITPVAADCSSVAGQSVPYDGNAHVGVGACKDLGGNAIAGLSWGTGQTDVPGGLVSWSFTSANPNYQNNAGGSVTVTITPATASITVNGYSVQYDGNPHGLTGTATGVGGADLSSSLSFGSAVTDVPGGSITWNFNAGANYNTASGSATVTITQAPSTTLVTCPLSVPYTSLAQEPCTVSVTGANLNLAPSANYSDNENVGTASASYTFGGDLNHTGSGDSKTFQITAVALTINGAVANDKAYDGDNTATVNLVGASLATPIAGDDVTINSSGYSATFNDENVDQDKPVTVTGVTLSGADAGNYTVSQPTGLTADITAKQITLVDAVANGKVYDGTTDATVDFTNADLDGVESGDAVSFDASLYDAEFADKDVNTGITVTVTGVTLTGAQAGNYELVDPTILVADITPRLVSVSINPQTKVYDGNTSATLVAADFVVTTGVTDEGFTVNQTSGNYNDADVADANTVTATLAEANFVPDNAATLVSNYDFPASASGPGSITKAPTTTSVTFEAGPYFYRGTAFTATASVTGAGGLNQPVTPVNVSGDCVNVTAANGCTASATYAESANHFSSSDSESITILKANATVVVNAYDVVYDGLSHTSTYSITGVHGETGAVVGSVDVSGTTHTAAGTYNNDPWTFTGTGNYNDTSGTVNNQIDKADATCNISGYGPLPYDGASHGATGSCTGVGSTSDVLAGLNLGTSFTNYPGGTADWTFTDVTGNYNNTSGSVLIDITKASATVVVTPYDVTYDGNAHTATVTSINGVNSETGATVGTVNVSGTTHTDAGTYNDTWSFTGTANYHDQLNVPITNQIDQASVTATAGSGSNVYDGATHAPSACVVSGTFTGMLSCANDPSVVGPNAGTTVIEPVTTGPDLANFIVTEVNGSYEISKADATIVVTPYDVVYDGNSHTATGTATGAGGENLNALLDLSETTHTNAAAYPGDPWSFAGDANHNPDSGTVDDNISKASVTATAGGGSATYDGNTKTPAACVVSGAYTGSLSCVNVPTTIGPGAGTYTIEPSTSGPDLANFIVTPANGTFTISKATTSTVVTCGAGPFVYSGLAQEPCTAQVTGAGGLNQSLTVTYSNNVNAGLATASASYAESANYFRSNDSKNFTIGKKQVSVTASSPTLPYNSAVPTITPIYGGLVNSETGAVIDVPPSCSVAGYNVGSPVGNYTTSCTGGSDNNYSFGPYVNGTFTVTTIYCFNGFFSPVGGSVESNNGGSSLDPVRTFKLNSTIPFKFALYNLGDCSGTPVTTGIHTIRLQKINSNNELESAIDATPTDAATAGNQFRLTGTEWHFNLDTKKAVPNVSAGTWLVTATLQDGSTKTVWISIKK